MGTLREAHPQFVEAQVGGDGFIGSCDADEPILWRKFCQLSDQRRFVGLFCAFRYDDEQVTRPADCRRLGSADWRVEKSEKQK